MLLSLSAQDRFLKVQRECDTATMEYGIALMVAACGREKIGGLKLISSNGNSFKDKQRVAATDADAMRQRSFYSNVEFSRECCSISGRVCALSNRSGQDGSLFGIVAIEADFC